MQAKTTAYFQRISRREFVQAALASDAAVEAGAAVYRAEDVHAWMERLAMGEKPPRPAPWRK